MRQPSPRLRTALSLLLAAGGMLSAQGLPTPILLRADPQMVYPGTPGWLDANGRVAVVIYGENLAPNDGDNGHPSGPDGGYQHIFIRGVSPHGDKVSPWVAATAANGCQVYGSASVSAISLGVDPARYLSEPGSHLQVKLWVSLSATGSADPVGSGSQSSAWSAIRTIDVAPAGATKPAPVAAPASQPVISRILPSDFTLGTPGLDYRLRIYGTFASGACRVIFNGDAAAPVPGEDAAVGYEMTPAWTSTGPDNVFHVTIPARYRRTTPGQLTIAVVDQAGRTTPGKAVTFTAAAMRSTGRPQVPSPLQDAVQARPAADPSLAPKAPPVAPSRFEGLDPVVRPLPRIPEVPPDARAVWQRLSMRLQGPIRSRYDLARMQALQAVARPGADPGPAVQSLVRQQFPMASAQDIDALSALVLMDCAQAEEQELREALSAMDQANQAKRAQRERLDRLRSEERRLPGQPAGAAGAPQPPLRRVRRAPAMGTGVPTIPPTLLHPVLPAAGLSREQLDAEAGRLRGDLDTLGDLDQAILLRLQLQMDRRAKLLQALSNLMRKVSATTDTLLANLK